MHTSIPFPNTSRSTTPLGLGLATLMREPSSRTQQYLLQLAYDVGFRHFDVAPSYGLGTAERALGRFLQSHMDDVTVGTKVGIAVRRNFMRFQAIQRPIRAMLRRFPSLRGRATRAVGSAIHARSNFALSACTLSLENSLRELKRDSIDLLLLHDPEPEDLADGQVLEWIAGQKQRGLVRNVGIATSPTSGAKAVSSIHSFDVVQVPSNILAPAIPIIRASVAQPLCVTHSAIALPLGRISQRMATDPTWTTELSEHVRTDVREPGVIPRLLLAWALHENSGGIVLLGASKAEHIRAAPQSLDAFAADQLDRVSAFLRLSLANQQEVSNA